MSSSYNRNTELRNVHNKDLYNLAVILDNDNYWQILMEVIPQQINNQTFGTEEDLEKIALGTSYERKYSNDHIRLIENAIRRPGESRLYSQILFDEWGTSGRKHERPTLGVLLHLLVQTKLYRAADFVAEILNEPKPSRPTNGPAAEFVFEVDVFNDIQETVNDTRFYPNTEDLEDNFSIDINKDYYTKYHKIVDKKISAISNTENSIMTTAPKPPPRLHKSARLKQQQLLQQTVTKNNINNRNAEEFTRLHQLSTLSNKANMSAISLSSTENMPKISALINTANSETATVTPTTTAITNISMVSDNALPKLSALNISDEVDNDSLNSTPSLIYTKTNIDEDYEQQHPDLNSIPIVVFSKPLNIDCNKGDLKSYNNAETHDLPDISLVNLNLNGDVQQLRQYQQSNNFENIPSIALNFAENPTNSFVDSAVNGDVNFSYNHNSLIHRLESIEEDYNGIEHEQDNDAEVELDDDEDSIPNLSFLENRSSNNESSLTSVTNTSGDNSFEQSVNDCSSASTDNVPCLSVSNP